ncbi:MAG: hypothetical protein ACFBSE_20355 [Prochloraceae cyanobacterium]
MYFIPQDWVEFLPAFIFSAALFVYLSKKLDNIQEKIILAILTITWPFLPLIIPPLAGCYFADRLSSANRKKLSLPKRFLLGNFKIALIILCFVGIMNAYHLPGLIVSPHFRNIWGTTFNYPLKGTKKRSKIFLIVNLLKMKLEKLKVFHLQVVLKALI